MGLYNLLLLFFIIFIWIFQLTQQMWFLCFHTSDRLRTNFTWVIWLVGNKRATPHYGRPLVISRVCSALQFLLRKSECSQYSSNTNHSMDKLFCTVCKYRSSAWKIQVLIFMEKNSLLWAVWEQVGGRGDLSLHKWKIRKSPFPFGAMSIWPWIMLGILFRMGL